MSIVNFVTGGIMRWWFWGGNDSPGRAQSIPGKGQNNVVRPRSCVPFPECEHRLNSYLGRGRGVGERVGLAERQNPRCIDGVWPLVFTG
jgi:hypothetical protein